MTEFQNTYRTIANELMQAAFVGYKIKSSELKTFFEFADNIVAVANAVKSVFSAFRPVIDNDIIDTAKVADKCSTD